jgi:hypothetical protein
MKYLVLLLALLTLSCSPKKQFQKLLKDNPSFITTLDTTVHDTVRIESVRVDTAFIIHQDRVRDTFTVVKDRLKVKVSRVHDTIQVDGSCVGDTIVRTITVPAKGVFVSEPIHWYDGWEYAVIALLILLVVVLLRIMLKSPNGRS